MEGEGQLLQLLARQGWDVVHALVVGCKKAPLGLASLVALKGLLTASTMDRMGYHRPGQGGPYVQGLFAHFLLAFGGGTCVAIATGTAFPSLLSPILVPIHVLVFTAYFYVAHPHGTRVIGWILPLMSPLLLAADSILRSASIVRALLLIRTAPETGALALESLHGQLILGTMAATGGGFVFRWAYGHSKVQYSGHDVSVVLVATLLAILLLGPPSWLAAFLSPVLTRVSSSHRSREAIETW